MNGQKARAVRAEKRSDPGIGWATSRQRRDEMRQLLVAFALVASTSIFGSVTSANA